jgi:hypothetical protein
MMKVKTLLLAASAAVLLSSCYSYSFSMGEGAQKGVEVRKKNPTI